MSRSSESCGLFCSTSPPSCMRIFLACLCSFLGVEISSLLASLSKNENMFLFFLFSKCLKGRNISIHFFSFCSHVFTLLFVFYLSLSPNSCIHSSFVILLTFFLSLCCFLLLTPSYILFVRRLLMTVSQISKLLLISLCFCYLSDAFISLTPTITSISTSLSLFS